MSAVTSYAQLQKVASIFRNFPHPWFVSGGWAIDLFRGEVTRDHEDLEIGIFRSDQRMLRFLLQVEWHLEKAVDTGEGMAWVSWYEGEFLELPIHQVKASQHGADPPEFELFLNDTDGDQWWFRRDAEIRRPKSTLALQTPDGIPYLRPEIQLLYKARLMRDKDRHDFDTALHRLDPGARAWLRRKLAAFLADHEWLARL